MIKIAIYLVHNLQTGWYLTGGWGTYPRDISHSLDFGVPLTGIDSEIPEWDAFNPPHWNEFCSSMTTMSDNKLLIGPSTTMLLF